MTDEGQPPERLRPDQPRTRRTLVTFHAHPDDEALLTAGTMAKATQQGHRVVLVVATDGDAGLVPENLRDGRVGTRRLVELRRSAAALGVARVVHLGYADSGMVGDIPPDLPDRRRFLRVPIEEAAAALARILLEEGADVLTTYDENGGYGHRDHVRVHQVGALAAEIAATPRVLEATAPRDLLARVTALIARLPGIPEAFDPQPFQTAYSARRDITHRIDVRRQAPAKRAAMAAHVSQSVAAEGSVRTLGALLKLPRPLFALVFRHEWYVDPACRGSHRAAGSVSTDIFDGL